MPEVRVIQPIAEQAKKQRVAAYARVSSDSADQLNSFATQVEYYTSTIQAADEWEFAGLYADEGVTGTTADKREDFQRLLHDCRAGKIDRILVKSISRFARNTLDCIQTVRELKQLGVAVVFEKEGIDTGSMGSEMLLSILGAAAQEESLSISQNLKWSYQKRMRSGDFITCSAPLGYFLKGNTLVPDPQEVPIVKHIFASYLAGKSMNEIATDLNNMELQAAIRFSDRWNRTSLRYILTNEKYIGDALVQKNFTPNEIPLRKVRNNGQMPKYYIQESHPAIISREAFEIVQRLLDEKVELHTAKTAIHTFPLSRNIGNVSAVSSAQIYSPYSYSGGIAGSNDGIIRNCYNIGSVSAASSASSSPYSYSGGIAGISNAAISNCYNTGSVSSSTTTSSDSYSYSGGIVGSSNTEIRNCYNRGDTTINKELGCGIAYLESEATIMDSYYLADTGRHTTGAVSLTNAQMQLSSTFRGFDFDGVWIQNKDYEYPYPQLRDNPQNMQEVVELIRLVSPPNKLAYFQGDELDTTGGMIEVLYVSGNAERFSITPDMVSGYDSSRLETQTLTVTYRGHTTTFDIIVSVRPKVVGMELLSGPDTTSFVKGTAFDFSGTQINVVYDNGGSAVLDVTDDMLSGADISQVGEQTVTVTFEGYTATFIITVLPVEMESLELTTLPKKTEYLEGEELDTTGLTLTARYNNGDERVITYGYTVTGYSPEPGTHTVTVEYSTKTATFEVKVKAKSVVSLEITQMPDKTEYFEGEEFDPTGLIVTATYDNGDKQAVTDYTYSGFDGKAGLKAIVVSYCGKTAAFSVKIQVRTVISLRIVQQPDKVLYLEGEDFDPTGLIVEATYSDGKTETVTDYELSGFSSTEGLKSIAVMYGGKIVSFTVTVMKTALEDLRITYPTKLTYYIGEAFDASGMVVTACYSNGKEIQVTDYTVEGFDSSTEGHKTLTVSYGGLTRAFVVTVIPRPIPAASFTVETVSGRPGEVVKVTVSVEKNPGLAGFRHTLTFDAAALRLEDVVMEGSFAEGTLVLNEEQTAQGQVTLVWFQTSDNLESGAVYTLTFTILEEAEGEYPITLTFDDWDNGNAAGENVLFQKQDGMVEALAYWLGDVTEDRQLTMKDVLLLAQVVSGQDIKLTENQQLAADVNENGAIDIHDVILLSQWLLDEPIGNEVMNI